METLKKKSRGRKKIEIKCIEKEESRRVCFSKRRQGLFKKANELCTLCGVDVAIVVFSLAGKPYSFGHPSFEYILHRFLNVPDSFEKSPIPSNYSDQMNQELIYLHDTLEVEMKRRGALEEALKATCPLPKDCDLRSMGIEELREYGKVLLEHQALVAQAAQQCSVYQVPDAAMGQIDFPPVSLEVEEVNPFHWLQQQDFELAGSYFYNGA